MEIIRSKEDLFIRITVSEAHALIKSLSSQLLADSPNVGRLESYSDKEEYFSIAVQKETATRKKKKRGHRT